jgi:hypothetical protein
MAAASESVIELAAYRPPDRDPGPFELSRVLRHALTGAPVVKQL